MLDAVRSRLMVESCGAEREYRTLEQTVYISKQLEINKLDSYESNYPISVAVYTV